MQVAYNRAQVGTRAAQWINPKKGELLIPDRAAAYKLLSQLESQLKTLPRNTPGHKKAQILSARALLYEAVGDPKMLEAAEAAFKMSKTANSAHMMAVALHHFGRIQEACQYYTQAYRFPHEEGFNVDLAYTQALLFQGKWSEAHRMTLGLKKRMVYAAYLPEWDRSSTDLSLISEGGYGDLIQCGRWIPILTGMGKKVTVYLPNYFFESGFVDLWRKQSWCPEIKLLTECPQKVPAVGFFDLPAVFDVQPDAIPPSLTFKADPVLSEKHHKVRTGLFPNAKIPTVGFCWAARQQETPLVPDGIYRALTEQQAERILSVGFERVRFVNLQKDLKMDQFTPFLVRPEIRSWEDTAAIIENLDAVVTVDTAIMHLAGAMGKPTIVILSGAADWKFGLNDEICKWYPSVKIIRNNGFGFETAVEKVIETIAQWETVPPASQI